MRVFLFFRTFTIKAIKTKKKLVMASKNTIRVKVQFEKDFLCACLQCSITPKRAYVSDPKFSYFAIQPIYYQAVFELGYSFCKLTGQRLF